MKSAEYWQKRSEQVLIDNEKLAINYEKEMAKIYEETKLKTEMELEAFYQRYAKENNLDLADVRQRLNPSELKKFRTQQKIYLDKVKKLIQQGVDSQDGGLIKYNKVLEELSARAYVTKLQEIQNNLNSEIMLLTGEQQIKLTDVLKTSYLDGYFKTMYTVQKGLGMGVSFTKPSNDDVLKILKTPWNGANYSTRVWNNKGKLTDWLNTDLPRHFASGESVQTMASDLKKKLDTNKYNATRLVRTEVNHISNQSTMDAYENSNVVEQYQILATLDSRTSDICRDMDNKIFKLSEKKVAVTMPPFHVNCRTTTVPYFEEYQNEDDERIARNSSGQTYKVPASMSYKEWDKKYGQSSVKQEESKQEEVPKQQKQTEQKQEVQAPVEPNYKDLTQKDIDNWSNNIEITTPQKASINSYTRGTSDLINEKLNRGEQLNGTLPKCVKDITDAMKPTNEDMFVYKVVSDSRFSSRFADEVTAVLRRNYGNTEVWKENLVGQVLKNEGFESTAWTTGSSYIQERIVEQGDRYVLYKIKTPKGTKALPIENISAYPEEKEILLDKGSRYIITDVRKVSGYAGGDITQPYTTTVIDLELLP